MVFLRFSPFWEIVPERVIDDDDDDDDDEDDDDDDEEQDSDGEEAEAEGADDPVGEGDGVDGFKNGLAFLPKRYRPVPIADGVCFVCDILASFSAPCLPKLGPVVRLRLISCANAE